MRGLEEVGGKGHAGRAGEAGGEVILTVTAKFRR